jgi:hypothetical protein
MLGAGDAVAADVLGAYPLTLPLTLLTSANEAATIGFGLGLSRACDRPNRLCVAFRQWTKLKYHKPGL